MKKIFSLILAGLLAAAAAVSASAAMFTDFEGYESFEEGENPVYNFEEPADYWDGAWSDGGDNGDELICEIRDGVGFGGSKGLAVGSMGTSNVGTYLFATANNKIPTDHTGSKFLRVWCDFTEVEFRKANFGLVDNMSCLFTTDEVDGAWDCEFYYSADGVNWEEYFHGGDGCFGDAQGSYVQETKGWYAFPIEDFAIRGNANWEAYDELTVANPAAVTGVYLFWDYSDAGDYAGKTFILDNIELVADYKADLPTGDAAPAAEPAPVVEEAPVAAEEPVVEAPVEEAAEAPVEETVEAPAAEAPVAATEAPETFDAGIIAAVAAVVSLAGYAVSKKR